MVAMQNRASNSPAPARRSEPPENPESDADQLDVSVVAPLFEEKDNVPILVERLLAAMGKDSRTFEILLVDDGSTDGTAEAIATEMHRHAEVRGIFLVRNYGQSTAMQAGFDAARGHLIVTMDGDLQNDPEDILAMIRFLEERGVDLVSGWRRDRKDPRLRKFFSRVANRLISRLTKIEIHDFGCSLKVYRREILDRTRLYGEMHRFLPALLTDVGARTAEMVVRHHPRRFGQSKYSLDRTFRVSLDLLLVIFLKRYLQRPLHIFGGFGIVLTTIGLGVLTYLTSLKIFYGEQLADRPLLIFGVLFVMTGIMLLGQGLLGELIGRLLFEAGGRAQYYVRPAPMPPASAPDPTPPDTTSVQS